MALCKCNFASRLRSIALQGIARKLLLYVKLLCAVALHRFSAQIALVQWLCSSAPCEVPRSRCCCGTVCALALCASCSAQAQPLQVSCACNLCASCPAPALFARYSLQVALRVKWSASALHKVRLPSIPSIVPTSQNGPLRVGLAVKRARFPQKRRCHHYAENIANIRRTLWD